MAQILTYRSTAYEVPTEEHKVHQVSFYSDKWNDSQ